MKYLTSPPPPPNSLRWEISRDERGITLQTLIVTTVLVLMAVAAGVVIMAITNSANDRLRGQQTDQDSACEPWEVHDIGLESAGRGGPSGNGGIESSAIGCRRVCYVKVIVDVADIDATAGERTWSVTAKSGGDLKVAKEPDFLFSRSDKTETFPSVHDTSMAKAEFNGLAPVSDRNIVDLTGNGAGLIKATITDAVTTEGDVTFDNNLGFAVHASGNYCIVEDSTQTTANQREILRSSK